MMGVAYVNSGRMGFQVVPFGGIDGRLGTNPLAFAAPRRADPPIMVDMTTCTVADGKIPRRHQSRQAAAGGLDHR